MIRYVGRNRASVSSGTGCNRTSVIIALGHIILWITPKGPFSASEDRYLAGASALRLPETKRVQQNLSLPSKGCNKTSVSHRKAATKLQRDSGCSALGWLASAEMHLS
jgi:hypothetical protein